MQQRRSACRARQTAINTGRRPLNWAVIPALIDQPTMPGARQIDHGRHIEPAFGRPDVGEGIRRDPTSGSAARPRTAGPEGSTAPPRSGDRPSSCGRRPGAVAAPARPAGASAVRSGAGRIRRRPPADHARPRRAPSVRSLARKLAFTCWPTASSLRDLALGDRFSQAWKPDRDTPNASHSHATGGIGSVPSR